MTEGTPRPPREPTGRRIEPEVKKPTPDIFKRVAELLGLAALLAGLILSLGWSYAYAWFQAWKMPLATLSIGADQLFEYGRLALVANLGIILPTVAVLIAILWVIRTRFPALATAIPLLMVAGLLVSWLGAHWMGKRAALADFDRLVQGQFQLLPLAEIVLKPDVKVSGDFARDIAPGQPCYRVVYIAPDAIWLARTRDNNRDPLVAMVPRDRIVLLRLYPRQGNCPAGAG